MRAQLWDLKTFKIRVDLPGHADEVYCVDFVADKIASGGRDKKVKMCGLPPRFGAQIMATGADRSSFHDSCSWRH